MRLEHHLALRLKRNARGAIPTALVCRVRSLILLLPLSFLLGPQKLLLGRATSRAPSRPAQAGRRGARAGAQGPPAARRRGLPGHAGARCADQGCRLLSDQPPRSFRHAPHHETHGMAWREAMHMRAREADVAQGVERVCIVVDDVTARPVSRVLHASRCGCSVTALGACAARCRVQCTYHRAAPATLSVRVAIFRRLVWYGHVYVIRTSETSRECVFCAL
jgi:hypothetical protein